MPSRVLTAYTFFCDATTEEIRRGARFSPYGVYRSGSSRQPPRAPFVSSMRA